MSKRHSKDLRETTPSPKKKKRSEVSTIGVLVDTIPLFLTGFELSLSFYARSIDIKAGL